MATSTVGYPSHSAPIYAFCVRLEVNIRGRGRVGLLRVRGPGGVLLGAAGRRGMAGRNSNRAGRRRRLGL